MRRVLFITVSFYEYIEKIKDIIEIELDAEVDLLILNSTSSISDGILNMLTKGRYIKEKERKKQFNWFRNHNEVKYDYIFTIVGRNLNISLFREFIDKQPNAEKILYLWDDMARVDNMDAKKQLFDRIISFDKPDCEQYHMEFIPLFYLNEYRFGSEDKEIDFLFAGSSHSGRMEIVEKILNKYPLSNYKWCVKFVVSKPRLIAYKIKCRNKILIKYFTAKNMTVKESAKILKKSKIDIDIPHTGQNGLSIRMFETLASHTKVITTNPEIRKYKFYNSSNICVIDAHKPVIPDEFINTPYKEIDKSLVEQFSVNAWIKAIFRISDNQYPDMYA